MVEIDGIVTAAFSDVTPPGGSVSVVEYRSGTDNGAGRPMRGNLSVDRLTFRRGFDGGLELYQWWNEVREGNPSARRTLSMVLLDEQGQPVTRWTVLGAFPSSHRFERLDAMSSLPVIEVIEIVYSSYEMT